MNYEFPYIEHISQVTPLVKDNPAFVIADKGEYTVINYLLASPEVFPEVDTKEDAILRECRGIAFDSKSGKIISRPFHKFFNLEERPETRLIWAETWEKFTAYEKLDGSMIRPLFLPSGMRLGTRMGITDVAMQAEQFIVRYPNYEIFMELCHKNGYTPIFEWCSRKQRIVLDYSEDNLVLLAIRDTKSGIYLSKADIYEYGHSLGIPVVRASDFRYMQDVADHTKKLEGQEGYVIVFNSGHRVKVKSDWYVLLHKTKEFVSQEKNLLKCILTNALDDIKPTLPEHDLRDVEAYEKEVTKGIATVAEFLLTKYHLIVNLSQTKLQRKEFAEEAVKLGPLISPFMFKLYDNKDIMEEITNTLIKSCGSGTKLNASRWLMNFVKYKEGNTDESK
jgi:RNA ligase